MPSTKELRARIRSVTNTAKVTGAMQLIAASKMRRAQEQVSKGKEYSETLNKLLSTLSSSVDSNEVNIPLLEKSSVVDDNIRDDFKRVFLPYCNNLAICPYFYQYSIIKFSIY